MPSVHSRCRASSIRGCRSSLPSIDMVIHHCLSSLSIMYRVLVQQLLSLKIFIVRDTFVERAQSSHPTLPSRYGVAVIIISFSSSIIRTDQPYLHDQCHKLPPSSHHLVVSTPVPYLPSRTPAYPRPSLRIPSQPRPFYHYRFIARRWWPSSSAPTHVDTPTPENTHLISFITFQHFQSRGARTPFTPTRNENATVFSCPR